MARKLFGHCGSEYQEIEHRPDKDIPGTEHHWKDGKDSYVNKDGSTFILTRKGTDYIGINRRTRAAKLNRFLQQRARRKHGS